MPSRSQQGEPQSDRIRTCYSLVILDLDGTLVDSLPWFRQHVNDIADTFGFRRIGAGEEDDLRGIAPRELLRRLHVPLWKLPLIARHMRRLKSAHIDEIPLFPGTAAMLQALQAGGIRLALVTSDSLANARRHLGAECMALFSDVSCGASLFGKARRFRRVLRRTGVPAERAIAIGDEMRDIEAARVAGIACGAVAWGYGAPDALRALQPDLMLERMEDIAASLLPDPLPDARPRT